jgi:hypothetical protein
MKGYLLKDVTHRIGEPVIIESHSAENAYQVIFEDDGDTGYFYAAEEESGKPLRILDMLFIYEVAAVDKKARNVKLAIVWSTDWQRVALIIGNDCYAVFDFEGHGGYNLAGFPPPNEIWTKHPRALTAEMVSGFFS